MCMPVQATHHVGFYKHFLPYWFSNRNASTRAYIDKPCPRRGSSSLAGKIIHPNYSCLIITFGVTCRLKYKLHIRILTLRFIDWYINELILRGSEGCGGSRGVRGIFGKCCRISLDHFHEIPSVHVSTPSKNKYSMVKMCNRTPKYNILQFCTATAPPSLELPDGCRRGWGCRGRGRWSWGWGEGECGSS
jgi:hypothetical protein